MTDWPLFLYGTLRDPDILGAVLGRFVDINQLVSAASLDHAAVYFPGRVYPALVSRAGISAPGLLLAGATAADRAALDAFEGDEYRRSPLTVDIVGKVVTAHAYFPTVEIAPDAPHWTLERWTREHKPDALLRELAMATAARDGIVIR